jgi:hypothetical protein
MKTISFLLFVITTVFLVSQAQGTDWVSMGKDTDGTEVFYDSQTLTKLPTGIVKVWAKFQFSDEGRKDYIQSQKLDVKRFETLSHSLYLTEINCVTRETRTMAVTAYSTDGSVLHTFISKQQPPEGWDPVYPESMGKEMYKAVCPPQEKK